MSMPRAATVSDTVKRVVRRIPSGRVSTYGTVARVAASLDRPIGGARTVAWILASAGDRDNTPWHRVVGAGGEILLPGERGARQASRLRAEGVRFSKGLIARTALLDEIALAARLRPT